MASREQLRTSDLDRDRAAEVLRDAAAQGRLDAQELEERLHEAFSAKTYGQLDALVDDLRVPAPVHSGIQTRPARARFGRRLVAYLVDGIVIGLVIGILAAVAHGVGIWVGLLVSLAYFTFFEGGPSGAGLGKRLLGIRVVDVRTGGRLGYGRALTRWFARFLSAIPLYLGYFWMLGEGDGRCWHDLIAGDLVVYEDGRTERDLTSRRY